MVRGRGWFLATAAVAMASFASAGSAVAGAGDASAPGPAERPVARREIAPLPSAKAEPPTSVAGGIGQALLPETLLKVTEEQRALTSAPWAPGARSVVLSKARQYLATGKDVVAEEQRRVKVLSAAGAEEDADASITLSGGDELRSVSARTILPDGTVIDATTDTIRHQGDDESFQIIHVIFPRVEPGAILDWRVSYLARGSGFGRSWFLEEELPVLEARLFLRAPGWIPAGVNLPPTGVSAESYLVLGREVQRFTVRELSPAPREPNPPPSADHAPLIHVVKRGEVVRALTEEETRAAWAGRADDSGLFDWFKSRLGGAGELAATLVPKGMDPFVATQLVRDAVLESVRVEGTSPSRSTETPGEVFKAGVGTTGDVTALCAAMLRSRGIDASVAYIRRRTTGRLPKRILGWSVFDDALLLLYEAGPGGAHVYASATTHEPVGPVPDRAAGTFALPRVLHGQGLVQLPELTAAESTVESRLELALQADGSARGTLRMRARSRSAARWRRVLAGKDAKDREALILEVLETWSRSPEVSRIAVAGEQVQDGSDLVLRADVSLPYFAIASGSRLVFTPFTWLREDREEWASEKRVLDVDLVRPLTAIDEVLVKVPAGVATARLPEDRDIDAAAAGVYTTTCRLENQTIIATRRFRQDVYRFTVDQYPELRRWHLAMADADEQSVVLTLAPPPVP